MVAVLGSLTTNLGPVVILSARIGCIHSLHLSCMLQMEAGDP